MPAPSTRRPAPRSARALVAAALLLAGLTAACTPDGTPAGTSDPSKLGDGTAEGDAAAVVTVVGSGGPTLSAPESLGTQRATGKVPTFDRSFGTFGYGDGQLQLPTGIAIDAAGNAYVADSVGLQVFDATGTFVRRVAAGELVSVDGVAVTPDGARLYVAERTPPVKVFDASGAASGTVGEVGTGPGQLMQPAALALDGSGNLYVADAVNGRIEVFDAAGGHVRTIGEKGSGRGQFSQPRALAVGPDGRVYVGVGDSYAIQVFSPAGAYERSFAHGYKDETLFRIAGLALDDAGRLYASEAASHYIQVFDENGWVSDLGKLGGAPTQFNTPTGLAFNAGRLYVVDQQNGRIQVFRTP